MCLHLRRSDPASRRFIQYISMSSFHVLVRDATTGRIITKPREEELWLLRFKKGPGRPARNEWDVQKSVNEEFLELMHQTRKWHFSFNDYYDVIIWNHYAGDPWADFYPKVYIVSCSAFAF